MSIFGNFFRRKETISQTAQTETQKDPSFCVISQSTKNMCVLVDLLVGVLIELHHNIHSFFLNCLARRDR